MYRGSIRNMSPKTAVSLLTRLKSTAIHDIINIQNSEVRYIFQLPPINYLKDDKTN